MKKMITKLALTNTLILMLMVASLSAQQTYYYDFRNTFNEKSGAGPALIPLSTGAFVNEGLNELSCVSRAVYGFSQNSGVQFDNTAAGNFFGNTYSIEMYFQFLNNSGFKRIIDYKNQTSDSGLYCTANLLQFYNSITINTSAFVANQYVHLVVTRDAATEEVNLYVDGNLLGTFTDSSDLAILDNANVLNFFQDDLVFGGEARPGRIALLKLNDFVMDANDVTASFTGLAETSSALAFSSDITGSCLLGNVFNFTNESENSGGFDYTWEFGDGNFFNDTNATYSYTAAGSYTVLLIADNGSGCTDTVSTQVNVYSTAPVDLGPDASICDGTSMILDAGSGFSSYTWSTGDTSQTIIVSTTGTYDVTVTDTTGCSGTDTITVDVVNFPVLELGADTTLCFGHIYVLNATPGLATYNWSTGDTTESITVSAAGVYAVEVTNTAGCAVADTININYHPELIISLGADTSFCFGNTLTLDPGQGFAIYDWSDGSSLSTLDVSTTGTYYVDVTDAFGCSVSDTINVSVGNPVIVDLGNDSTFCGGTLITMDATSGFAGYLWSDGSQNQTLDVTFGGTYSVIVTDNNGCTGTDSITLTATPLVSLGPDQIWCAGLSTSLDAGPGMTTYLWNDGSSAQTLVVNTSGIYTVTVSDGLGCINFDEVEVTFNNVPVFDLGPDYDICDGQVAILDPGPGYMSYTWSDGSFNQTLEVTTGGTYWVLVSSAPNCDASDTITITVLPSPPLSLGNDTVLCDGSSLLLDAGVGFSAYLWSDGSTNQTLLVTASDIYIATITGGNGCETTDSIIVTFEQPPVVDLGPDQTACSSNIVILDAGSGPYTYLWNDNSISQTIVATSTGTYTVTVSSMAGCSAQDDVNITINPSPVVNLGPDTTLCDGQSIILDAGNPGAAYSWSEGSTTQTITVTTAGPYSVLVMDFNMCTTVDDINISYSAPVPTPVITQNINTLQSSSATGNQWYSVPGGLIPGATGQNYQPGANGTFYVIVTDANGCQSAPSADYIFLFDGVETIQGIQLNLFPNPATNMVTISTSGLPVKSYQIEMIDIIGKTVYHQEGISTGTYQLNIAGYPEGMYFIRVSADNYQTMKRLIINR